MIVHLYYFYIPNRATKSLSRMASSGTSRTLQQFFPLSAQLLLVVEHKGVFLPHGSDQETHQHPQQTYHHEQ
jgi:hypothetical protein